MKFLILLFLALAPIASHAYIDEAEGDTVQFSGYKPMYFLMGHPNTKIEVSFKAQVIKTVPVYFAYTQIMMWELFIKSPYFSDLNYNPEGFYRLELDKEKERWLDLSPFEHESNGRGKVEERSWNRAYARYQWNTKWGDRARIFWSVKAWIPYLKGRNGDIPRYRGLGEVVITLKDFFGAFEGRNELTLRLYGGGARYLNPLQGGQELTFRMNKHDNRFLLPLVVQVFHGYGENLIDYRERRLAIRAGIGF